MGIFDAFQRAFGNEEYGDPPESIKATARHILVPSLEDANMVLDEIGKGETTFASLAGRYSTCPSSTRGGSLGSFKPGNYGEGIRRGGILAKDQDRRGDGTGPDVLRLPSDSCR
jgi:hypothetical protein